MTEVNNLRFSGTRFVNMNSKRVWLHLVKMYSASVTPRNFELTVFDVTFKTQLYPMAKKVKDRIQIINTKY